MQETLDRELLTVDELPSEKRDNVDDGYEYLREVERIALADLERPAESDNTIGIDERRRNVAQ